MKWLSFLFLFWMSRVSAQTVKKDVHALCGFSTIKLSDTSRTISVSVIIVNDDVVDWFYPKTTSQVLNGHTISYSYKNLSYHRPISELSYDVASHDYNHYDSLISIRPSDTLIVEYNNVLMLNQNKGIIITGFLTPDRSAEKRNKGGMKYFDRSYKSVKIIEYKMEYKKGKMSDAIEVRNVW